MRDRAVPVDGSVNLRDLGGYSTPLGHTVRPRLLYRSGTLAHLTSAGRQQFDELNVKLICDLRRPDEKADEPTPFPHGEPHRLEIEIDPGSALEMRKRLSSEDLGFDDRVAFMTALTGELTRDHAADYARMFEGLLEMPDGGFLVHCSAGKDRTGVACALILHALGVPKETVIQDYLLTNDVIDYEGFVLPKLMRRYEPDLVPDKNLVMTLAGVREEYLHAAYDAIEEQFDDVEHFIEDAIGLDQTARTELQIRYLDGV